jgi:AGCS family alanine or glycine:cation symporter
MQEIVNTISGLIWEPVLIYLALGTGLFFSITTRFVQVRMFREMIHLLFSGKESDRGISSFQALAVSLSGRVGVGNIAGVAAAIGIGGPGAVFWMWIVAFLGSATAYIESALGQIYKEEDEGQFRGGPAYYFEKALGQKWYRNGTRGYLRSLLSLQSVCYCQRFSQTASVRLLNSLLAAAACCKPDLVISVTRSLPRQ